ncbi:MAG: PH domain-containing protein [Flavobacteriaceae bacterium]|nr:PH domain-containing protein [Flavobacteriaceae bacterium]
MKPILIIVVCMLVLPTFILLFWISSKGLSYEIPKLSFSNFFEIAIPLVLVFWILINILDIIYYKMTRIYLYKHYITLRTGILSKNLDDISLNKYEGLSVSQSWLGRILNYGVLAISTGEISQFYLIEKPLELRKHILEQRAVV